MQAVTAPGTPGDSSSRATTPTRRFPTVTGPGPAVPSLRCLRPTPSSLQFRSVRVGFYLFLFCFVTFCHSNTAPCRENLDSSQPGPASALSRIVSALCSALVPALPSLTDCCCRRPLHAGPGGVRHLALRHLPPPGHEGGGQGRCCR